MYVYIHGSDRFLAMPDISLLYACFILDLREGIEEGLLFFFTTGETMYFCYTRRQSLYLHSKCELCVGKEH